MGTVLHIIGPLLLASVMSSAQAQEVSIPDPGLSAAIRETLQKPIGPLTRQDLLSLTNFEYRWPKRRAGCDQHASIHHSVRPLDSPDDAGGSTGFTDVVLPLFPQKFVRLRAP